MAAKPASIVSSRVARHALATSQYLQRVLAARSAGTLRARDVDRAFQGAYLEFYVTLEEEVEYLFYGLLMGRLVNRGTRAKVVVRSESTAKQIVLGGKEYADWLPIRRTIDRAETFFYGGTPFDRLDDGHRSTFSDMKVIRDAIAHSGPHAATKFRKQIIEGRPIPVRERSPASYLAGLHAGSRTRMDELIARASIALAAVCN